MGKPQCADAEASRALDAYTASAKYFAKKEIELLRKHPNQWVGVYHGRVCAIAKTLDELIQVIESKRIPTAETLARYLNEKPRTLIL